MLLPIGDDQPERRIAPLLNYLFITVNVVVFVVFQVGTSHRFTSAYCMIPGEILTGRHGDGVRASVAPHLTLFTSMFLHGNAVHLFGNMLFLWIFGANLEDRFGRERYFVFYVSTGILAALAHVFCTDLFGGNEWGGYLGASGAISGVLGGYAVLFPRRRVRVLILRLIAEVPAIAFIGLWFTFQLCAGTAALDGHGGIAYGAHIGGFLAGVALVKSFDPIPRGAITTAKGGHRSRDPW